MKRITTTISAAAIAAAIMLGGCTGARQDQGGSLSLMERFHSGKSLIGNERTLTADEKDKDLTQDQRDARESFMRGLSYLAQSRRELAFEQFSRACALDPNLTQARYQRGLILMEQQMPAPALDEFKAVMEQMPDYAPGYAAAGRVYFTNGLYPEAEKLFNAALERDPQLLEAYDHLGAIHNYNKQYDMALGTFQKALMINPNAAYLYNNLGLAYSMLGRDADAVEAFRKAVMQGAPSAKAYNNMGLALCRMGKYREGLEAFRASGGEAAAWNNLGYFFFLDGQNERAIRSFEKAIELEPTYYERAAENLKRARLAAQFADNADHAPARPGAQDDLFAPAAPVVPSSAPQPGMQQGIPAVQPVTVPAQQQIIPLVPPAAPAKAPENTPAAKPVSLSVHEETLSESPAQPVFVPQQMAQSVTQPEQTAAAAAPAESADGTYALHASSFRSRQAAEAHAARLLGSKIDARVVAVSIPGRGNWNRVVIGRYDTVETARNALSFYSGQPALKDIADLRVVNTAFFARNEESEPAATAQAEPEASVAGTAPATPDEQALPVQNMPEPAFTAPLITTASPAATRQYALMHVSTTLVPLP